MKKIILVISLFAFVVASCVKMPNSDPNLPENELGLKIPDNFDWKTTKEIKVSVGVTAINLESTTKQHVIKIYNSPLLNSGSLIAAGAAMPGKPFNVTLSVASIIDKLYIYEAKPNGLVTVTEKEITSSSLQITLANSADMFTKSNTFTASNVAPPTLGSMPFPTNYDVTVTDNSTLKIAGFTASETNVHGNTYKSYYIPEGITRTADINFNNGPGPHAILYVKGTLNISAPVLYYNSLVILEGGTVNLASISTSTTVVPIPYLYIAKGASLNLGLAGGAINVASMINKGTITSMGSFVISKDCIFINEGDLSITATNRKLIVSENSILYNSGTITTPNLDITVNSTVTNDVNKVITTELVFLTAGSVINNHGEIVATKKFYNTVSGTVNNFCRILANETNAKNLTANLKTGSLWSSQKFTVDNSIFTMDGGSIFLTATISPAPNKMKFISTSSTYALFKNTGTMLDIRAKECEISGNIEYVHEKLVDGVVANGKDLYLSSIKNGAILSKVQTKNIPGTGCNQSLGQIEATTPPVDPNLEFVTYFPSQSGWATYAFEDQWPAKGDYDLNDLVILFRVTSVTNSSNLITKLHFDYILAAAGAMKQIGTAFQLNNVMASNIKSVSGQVLEGGSFFTTSPSGVENGASKAIIPVFNSTKSIVAYSKFLNTEAGESNAISEKRISIEFNTPVNQADITMSSFNFFIVADSRGKEIHLPGYAATEKFNASFATAGSLHSSDYFKHSDGMMWGLMFPDSFAYPLEKASIIDAYKHFAAWAISGGASYPNWYSNEEGYRNEKLIY